MKIEHKTPIHLTYCLNIHSGESWDENFWAITEKTRAIRDKVASRDNAFGLGLRLGNEASQKLANEYETSCFKAFLEEENMYAFTINGFPYGAFSGKSVKADVYQPDWRTPERLEYTLRLADILSKLLPEGINGSISTLPGSYKEWITTDDDRSAMKDNLSKAAQHLFNIHASTGKLITLGLEPEPDCYIETTKECIEFIDAVRSTGGDAVAKHLGICFDTCHIALQYEDAIESVALLNKNNILISKIQLSAALKVALSGTVAEGLSSFIDPVYLHQTRIRNKDKVSRYPDLTKEVITNATTGELRSHFHVPLYFEGFNNLESTADEISTELIAATIDAGAEHFEIETYTFDVLPENMRDIGVVESVAKEYEWVLNNALYPCLKQ